MLRHLISHFPFFYCVANHLNFSKAADELALSQSAISYQIHKLEDKLGFKLFIRGKGSKVELSDKGKRLYNEYSAMEKGFNQLLGDIQNHRKRKNIKITTPVDFGVKIITPLLAKLESESIFVELDLNDELILLARSEFDLSIRNNKSEQGLEYLELVEIENVLFCSENYAQKYKITQFSDINNIHRLLVRDKNKSNSWGSIFNSSGQCFSAHQNKQIISNSFGIMEAANSGLGIGILPRYFVEPQLKSNKLRLIQTIPATIKPTKFYLAYQKSTMAHIWALKVKKVVQHCLTVFPC